MLCSVADDGQEDRRDEGLGDAVFLRSLIDCADEVICREGSDDGDDGQGNDGSDGRHFWLFLFSIFALSFVGVVQEGVSAQLEDEVEAVDEDEHNRGTARDEDDSVLRGAVIQWHQLLTVEHANAAFVCGWQSDGNDAEHHDTSRGLCSRLLEGVLSSVDAAADKGHAEDKEYVG